MRFCALLCLVAAGIAAVTIRGRTASTTDGDPVFRWVRLGWSRDMPRRLAAGRANMSRVAAPTGFAWTQRKNGDVVVTHHGRIATTLRGDRAARFLQRLTADNEQELLARLTGNYKRGNERTSRRR